MVFPSIIKNWTIYKITNPVGQIYIGCSSNYKRRIKRYKYHETETQPLIHQSIITYGFEDHSFEIIDEFEACAEYAEGKEIFWIKTYMSNRNKYPAQNGLNLCNGGRNVSGLKMSTQSKEKMSQSKSYKYKALLCFNLKGEYIKEYTNIASAVKETGSRRHLINYVLKGRQSQTNGFIFKYK